MGIGQAIAAVVVITPMHGRALPLVAESLSILRTLTARVIPAMSRRVEDCH